MNRLIDIQGIIFDFGGTLDTNGRHWSELLWEKYQECHAPVCKEAFKEAYVYGERTLALKPLIKHGDGLYDVLRMKTRLQASYLLAHGFWDAASAKDFPERIADAAYAYACSMLQKSRLVVERLCLQHKLVLVSNFYGNIETILSDFGLLCFFEKVIESAVVGVRKPDPAIYQLGVEALACLPGNIAVVGDSFSKDMVPAKQLGCKTIWLRGIGWDEQTDDSLPDVVISSIEQLPGVIG